MNRYIVLPIDSRVEREFLAQILIIMLYVPTKI